MEEKEAIIVLHDVLAECGGLLLDRCVELSPVKSSHPVTLTDYNHYEVRIRCMVDDDLRICIGRVIDKHKLLMRQEGNEIILYH